MTMERPNTTAGLLTPTTGCFLRFISIPYTRLYSHCMLVQINNDKAFRLWKQLYYICFLNREYI